MKNNLEEKLSLYFIAGTQDVPHGNLLKILEEALKNGVTCFQYREKGVGSLTDPQEIYEMAVACQRLCRQYQVPFFINDDVDLALKIKADGIHVGQEDEKIESVIARVPSEMIVGLSCYDEKEIAKSNALTAVDYVGIGPVFGTISKVDAQSPIGLKKLTTLRNQSCKPIVAIGGINTKNAANVWQSHPAGICFISAITQAENISCVIKHLKKNN